MSIPFKKNPDQYPCLPRQLRAARCLLLSVLLFCMLLVCVMTADRFARVVDQADAAAGWMRRLDLSMPALWPSGTLLRAPESASSAVLPRLAPRDSDPWNETRISAAWQWCPGSKVAP